MRVATIHVRVTVWRLVALALIWSVCVGAASTAVAADEYSFAVVPQFEPRKLFAIWKPIVDEVEKRTGIHLELMATGSVSEFERQLSAGALDFTYTNPYHIMREASRQGYIPLVRDATPLRGVLMVPKDSPIQELRSLNGKVLAVPSPNAIGASLLIQADLERLHRVRMQILNVKSHSSVFLHLTQGLTDAGGSVDKVLHEQPKSIQEAVRVLYVTQGFPSHPVSAHPRVPVEAREKVRSALLEMAATPEGKALLDKVPMFQPVSASIQDYLPLADLGLEVFWVEGAQ